jgi:ketosteroid isomerase-like protein
MKTLAYLAWFAGAAALAFAQDNRKAPPTSAADQAALRAIENGHDAFMAAMRNNDANALARLLAPDAVFYPPNRAAVTGAEAVRKWYQSVVDNMKTTAVEISDRTVTLAGTHAIEEGRFVWNLAPSSGGAPIEDRGKFIAIWKRQSDGTWKVARDIWNSVLPAPSAASSANDALLTGTWELNLAKSQFNPGPAPRGETRTYAMLPDGRQHAVYDRIDADGNRVRSESTFTFDGNDSPIAGGLHEDTQAITRTGPRTISAVIKKEGKVVRTGTREVSEDGRSLTLRFQGLNPKGQPLDETLVFDRKDAAKSRLLRLTYMNVEPAKVADYVKRVREHYIPIHNERVAQGKLAAWKVYRVDYPNGEQLEYNFVIVNELAGFAQLESDGSYADIAKRVVGAQKYEHILANPIAKTMRTDTVVLREATQGWSTASSRLLNVAYLKVLPGKGPELMAIERDHYLRATEDGVKEGRMTAWGFGVVRFPEQRDAVYTHLSIAGYDSLAQMEKEPSAEHRAKWGKSAAEAMAKLPTVRTRVKGELWRLVAETNSTGQPARAAE